MGSPFLLGNSTKFIHIQSAIKKNLCLMISFSKGHLNIKFNNKIKQFLMKNVKTLLFSCAFFAYSFSMSAQNGADLFTPDNGNGRANLSSEMRTKLSKIERDSQTKFMACFKVGKISKLQKKGKLKFSLPNVNGQLTATARKIEAFSDNNYLWEGVIENGQGNITIRCQDGLTSGFIHYLNENTETNEFYTLYGLSNDLSLMLQTLKKGLCGLTGNRGTQRVSQSSNTVNIENRSVVGCTISGIRALVLSTANARNAVSNINQCAQMGIDQFNAAAANSGINWQTKLILAGVINLESLMPNFSSRGNFERDLMQIRDVPEVQNARDAANADIVVVLTDEGYSDFAGWALDRDASTEDAYCGVEVYTISNGDFVFTHEVGHLLGGMHDSDNETVNFAGKPLVAYSHAFTFKNHWFTNRLQYATVMNAGENNPRWKLNQFSNPNITHNGFATGTTNRNNVARRIGETTTRIGNYAPEPTITVYINGPTVINDFGTFSYDAVTSCGTAPYRWFWEASTDGFNYQTVLGSDDIFNHYYYGYGQQWSSLKVTVVDAQGRSNTAFKQIIYGGDIGIYRVVNNTNSNNTLSNKDNKEAFLNLMIYPNPTQNTLTVDFEQNNDEPIGFKLLDAQGREVMNDIDENLNKGRVSKKLDISQIPSGIYILKMTSGENSIIEKITIQK